MVITIVVALLTFVYQTAATSTTLTRHLNDPALHHNIIENLEGHYVPRPEIEGRIGGLKEDVDEIKEILRDISKSLKQYYGEQQ